MCVWAQQQSSADWCGLVSPLVGQRKAPGPRVPFGEMDCTYQRLADDYWIMFVVSGARFANGKRVGPTIYEMNAAGLGSYVPETAFTL